MSISKQPEFINAIDIMHKYSKTRKREKEGKKNLTKNTGSKQEQRRRVTGL